jgi:hypothetical protein
MRFGRQQETFLYKESPLRILHLGSDNPGDFGQKKAPIKKWGLKYIFRQ